MADRRREEWPTKPGFGQGEAHVDEARQELQKFNKGNYEEQLLPHPFYNLPLGE